MSTADDRPSTPNYSSALVTGASRGIGAAVVRHLRERGMAVHALAFDDDELHQLAAETGARPIGVDLRDTAATVAALGGLGVDVVVNNAGVLPKLESFAVNSLDTIDLMIDVNLRAALHVTRLMLPGMIERDRGHIVFMGSIAGRHPSPNSAVYGGTKAALRAFAEGLRGDLLGTGVRVTVLMPGRVETRLYDGIFGDHAKAHDVLYRDFDSIQPADIAHAITTALDMPPNVDLTAIEIVPTKQFFGGSTIARTPPPAGA